MLWDVTTGRELHKIDEVLHENSMRLAFAPDGKTLVATGLGIQLLDTATWAPRLRFSARHSKPVLGMAFSPDGMTLATCSESGVVELFAMDARPEELGRGTVRSRLGWPPGSAMGALECLAISPDGRTLACGGRAKAVHLWDLETNERRADLKGHIGIVSSLAFAPDGRTLASGTRNPRPAQQEPGGDGGFARVWDVKTGEAVAVLKGGDDDMSTVAFSPDGKILATSGRGTAIRLWNVAKEEVLATLDGHKATTPAGDPIPGGPAVNALAFSPDGKTLASGGDDRLVLLWDVPAALAAKPGN